MDAIELTAEQLIGPLNEVEAKNAPKRLFAFGDTDMLRLSARVSIVGSRGASVDGLSRAKRLATILCGQGVVVVSGLAKGIDTAAHTAAIAARGRTVAVIGTPIDKSYPRENAGLQAMIARQHLLVSQFPVGTKTRPYHFPERNRTMALISDATVIVEAGDSSGSLSQAWEALRLNRPLFIAASVLDNDRLTWPKELLGYGASILSDQTLDDLFAVLPDRVVTEEHADAAAF